MEEMEKLAPFCCHDGNACLA